MAKWKEGGERNQSQFYQVNFLQLLLNNKPLKVLILRNVTINILFNLSEGERRILQLVNACVSHEMRNPLNSILA